MMVDVKSQNLVLRLWFLMHRDYRLLVHCEDQIYGEKGLTMEQFTVLAAMKYLCDPVRPTDVAEWIGRSTNSVSMIIDRMVKAGLVGRKRDRIDRRVVHLVATSKGENALKLAMPAAWEFIQKIMLSMSQADRHTFARLLETLRYETLNYLNPGKDIEAMVANDDKRHLNMTERLFHDTLLSTPQAKRQSGKKGKDHTIKTKR
jgi:DNA-binding MarR family transcriptional regulator